MSQSGFSYECRKRIALNIFSSSILSHPILVYLIPIHWILFLIHWIAGDERPRGFERRLDPERIVGATDSSGELMFLIKVGNIVAILSLMKIG